MYKIIDLQGMGTHADEKFRSKAEIVEHLANYHDIDFDGTDDKDNPLDIYEYFKFWKINTVKEQLEWLLDYGNWDIKGVRPKLRKTILREKRIYETKRKACEECKIKPAQTTCLRCKNFSIDL